MIELFTTIHSLEKFQKGEETFAYSSLDWLKGNLHPIVKLILPLKAVEHLGHGEFRLLVEGMEY